MKHIRKFRKDAETIDMVYTVDDQWYLLDDIPIRGLTPDNPNQTVESITEHGTFPLYIIILIKGDET